MVLYIFTHMVTVDVKGLIKIYRMMLCCSVHCVVAYCWHNGGTRRSSGDYHAKCITNA